jgi:hypothetical protein
MARKRAACPGGDLAQSVQIPVSSHFLRGGIQSLPEKKGALGAQKLVAYPGA